MRIVVNQQGLSGDIPFTHFMVDVYLGQFGIANFDILKDEVDAAIERGKTLEHLLFEHLIEEFVLHTRYE